MPDDPAHALIAAIVRAVSEPLAQQPQLPALDFADIRAVFVNGQTGVFGQGEAEGSDRAQRAAVAAILDLKKRLQDG